ncbi:Arginine ABC transporter permease protein ArtM [Kluyvera intermedia]|nr:Arginine ABC transporter permease protein ArtM [Kluyvera intermedia]
MLEYLPELMKGLHTSLTLTVASIVVALILSLIFTIILTLKTPVLVWVVRAYITLFTGTPLLVQIFLIYYGPGQFPSLQNYPVVWHLLSEPWLCALIALSLNSAAYTTQLFFWRHSGYPGRSMAVMQLAGHEQERHTGNFAAVCA